MFPHVISDFDKITNYVILIHNGNIMFQKEMKNLKTSHFAVNGDVEKSPGFKIKCIVNKK